MTAVAALLSAAGCAADRVTWADVDAAPRAASSAASGGPGAAARVARMAPRRAPALAVMTRGEPGFGGRTPAPRAPTTVSAGLLIDGALQQFTGDRALMRGAPKSSVGWADAWNRVLADVGAACEIAPRATDLGAFVRARVTLEVELEHDRERRIVLPAHLDKRLRAVLGAVDESVGELRAANAPGTITPTPRLGDGELVLRAPVSPMIISSPFGVRADPFTKQRRFHNGVDYDVPMGTNVWAAASGLVVYAGRQGGYGNQVVLDHGDGVRTHYSHLSRILVEAGQTVNEGDVIAYSGSTGRSTGPHLHFAVTDGPEFIDPVAVLDIPFDAIAHQVRTGATEHRSFALENKGDTVEIKRLDR